MNYSAMEKFPVVSRHAPDILRLFGPESEGIQRAAQRALGVNRPILGNDLEFIERQRYVEEPTIIGVSDGFLTVSVPFNEGLPYFKELVKRHPDILYVGHAFTSADLFAFRNVGINIDVTAIEDTIIWYYLANMHLCKGTGKTEDGDGEKRGKGYMNLWAFISLYTSLPNWKECRGKECDGTYCPEHEPFQYNGIDSLAPVLALPNVVMQARMRGVDKLYPLHRELVYVLSEMTRYGIQTDPEYIQQLREELIQDKERIAQTLPFSPTSPKQVIEYFKKKGIKLFDAQEITVRNACEESDDPELLTLLEFKELGNGPDRWFGPKFIDDKGRIHGRQSIFTSSSRLQMSSPNLTNVGHWRVNRNKCECSCARTAHEAEIGKCLGCACTKFKPLNIGGKVRRGVVASPGSYLGKFDLKNGEGRVMFNFAGIQVPADAHTFTADLCKLTDDMEYCRREGGRRQAAKKIVHASSYL